MSADPKSLATLAISTANAKKRKTQPNIPVEVVSDLDGNSDSDVVHKFRSTDEFVAGWTAAFINTSLLFPINKLIFRQMAGGHGAYIAVDQMKEEGIRYLYRGILPPLVQKMVSVSIMFGSFGHYKKWADRKLPNSPHVVNLTIASCLTGTTEAVLTPLERVQMLLQDRKFHKDYKNTIDALIKLRKYGFVEYYRGITCVLMRNGPSNILFFGLRDEIKRLLTNFNDRRDNGTKSPSQLLRKQILPDTDSRLQDSQSNFPKITLGIEPQKVEASNTSLLHDFLSGAILGMFISTLFYPLSVVRTRMQTRAPGTEFLSIVKAFNAVYSERDRKFTRLFHGCLINVMRQFVSWGIINCSYECVLGLLHDI